MQEGVSDEGDDGKEALLIRFAISRGAPKNGAGKYTKIQCGRCLRAFKPRNTRKARKESTFFIGDCRGGNRLAMTVKLAQREAAEKELEMSDQNTQQTQQQTTQQQQTQQTGEQQAKKSWDDVLKEMPEDAKALYNEHTAGLQNTVKATRDERDDLAKQIKDLLPKAENGSELEKSLTEALGKMESSNKRADFVEQAIKPEIGCRNIKAAYAVALQYDLFKKNGDPDWDLIKKESPESFGVIIPDGDGGNGTETKIKTNDDFNAELRRRANS